MRIPRLGGRPRMGFVDSGCSDDPESPFLFRGWNVEFLMEAETDVPFHTKLGRERLPTKDRIVSVG